MTDFTMIFLSRIRSFCLSSFVHFLSKNKEQLNDWKSCAWILFEHFFLFSIWLLLLYSLSLAPFALAVVRYLSINIKCNWKKKLKKGENDFEQKQRQNELTSNWKIMAILFLSNIFVFIDFWSELWTHGSIHFCSP